MKKLLLLTALTFTVALANAQSFYLTKMSFRSKCINYGPCVSCVSPPVCYEPAVLEDISRQMFEAGNDKYIFVDLLKDGLMEENEVYGLQIDLDSNGLNDCLPVKLQRQYTDKWLKFVQANSITRRNVYWYNHVSICEQVIFDPGSSFRKLNLYDLWGRGFRQKEDKYILQEIITDGLGKPDEEYSFEISNSILKINNRTVLQPLRDKYYKLYKDLLGIDVTSNGSSYSLKTSSTLNEIMLKE